MSKKSLILIILLSLSFAPIAEAKKIVSLAPSITEILFLLNLKKEIVGVTANCDYPEEAKKIEKTGLFGSPNLEKIASLKPNIVLAPYLGDNSAIAKLKELNIPTLILPSQNINDVFESIKTVGRVTGSEEKSKIIFQNIQRRIEVIKKKVANRPRPKVLVVIWVTPNAIMTAGRRSFINELIGLAGGENLAADLDFHYPTISPEFVLAKNPDLIIFGNSLNSEKTINDLLAQPGLRNTGAVKTGRIYRDINPSLFLRPGPRLVEGLEEIAKRLHPDIFVTKEERLNGKT